MPKVSLIWRDEWTTRWRFEELIFRGDIESILFYQTIFLQLLYKYFFLGDLQKYKLDINICILASDLSVSGNFSISFGVWSIGATGLKKYINQP